MTLPPVSIPEIHLPFEIAQMMHPMIVHFAIALPVVIFLLEIINLFTKQRTIGLLSFFFMLLMAAVYFVAFLTGTVDGEIGRDILSPEAKAMLFEHQQLGVYLVYASGILLLLKAMSALTGKSAFRVFFVAILIIFMVVLFHEGKRGRELVYHYGINIASVPSIASVSEKSSTETNSSHLIVPSQKNTLDSNKSHEVVTDKKVWIQKEK